MWTIISFWVDPFVTRITDQNTTILHAVAVRYASPMEAVSRVEPSNADLRG